jgi:TRAP-type C4-dicarboxylate transport system permease small subunit
MDKLGRTVDRLAYGAGYLGALVLLGIIVLTMAEVVSRYVLNSPLILSDEFGGYALVAISCLGLAYCAQDGGHIRITFLVERIGRASGPLRVATLALGLVFVSVLAWVCWQFLADSFARNMRSNSLLMVPLKWPQLAMPVGFTLYAVVLLVQLVRAWRELRAGRSVDRFGSGEI